MASAYCVVPPEGKANLEKTGERRTRGTSGAASMTKGLPAVFLASKESVTGTSTVGMVVVPPCAGSRPSESVGALSDGVLERGHGALRARKVQARGEEGEQTNGLDPHIRF